jgi:hypothetical protein
MYNLELTPDQVSIVESPKKTKLFLEGPAGTGKTTAGVNRMLYLIQTGVPADSILIIVPQRTLGTPYLETFNTYINNGGVISLVTVGGLAQRMIDLFWPIIANQAGFARPDNPPAFLTLETAQYYMARLVRPLLEQGYFDSVIMDRNRLYSQIIDNLNKAAVVGFPHTEIGERLKSAWSGEPAQIRIYEDAQTCASLFRNSCLEHNLLDFSLQVEVFMRYLWPSEICQNYLKESFHHLIGDNLEEDTPVAHDLIHDWLPDFDSALLIYDHDAGYRRFLGADPQSAYSLKALCPRSILFDQSFVTSIPIYTLGLKLSDKLKKHLKSPANVDPRPILKYKYHRFFPEMLDWTACEIANLIKDQDIPPGEIVVIAPFLSDALRFSLVNRLQSFEIPVRSHRPSRSLREEPATQCLLTLAILAHPQWGIRSNVFDVAYALMQSIAGLDLIRAQILAEIVYRIRDGAPVLLSFDQIIPETQERITYLFGERYEHLRQWLIEYSQNPESELDHFLNLLFGEVLSQPGFGFHDNFDAGEVTANLIESVQKFRRIAGETLAEAGIPLGKEYNEMVQAGIIAAQYIRSWQSQTENAVLLSPAHTFLMSNRPVQIQFWLDIGSRGWTDRLYQPLTHPYVLSRNWPPNAIWTDIEEVETSQDTLFCLVSGLIRRCGQKLYLGLSELGEQGYEQRGLLLHAFQRVLQDLADEFPGVENDIR